MKFKIEQVALYPPDAQAAMKFLSEIGMSEWIDDIVVASGTVRGELSHNQAELHFNYQGEPEGPLELEVLHYQDGRSWMDDVPKPAVSHIGMHCSADDLVQWRDKMAELGVEPVQEVFTESHRNPIIAGKRYYNYVIFGTRHIIGVDLKFIVRYSVTNLEE